MSAERTPHGREGFRDGLACAVAVAIVYVVSAKLGFRMAFVAQQVTVVWPPTGIALAAVLLAGRPAVAGVALGAFVANVTTGESLGTAVAIAAGNTLEAFVGAGLLRTMGFASPVLRLRDVLVLVVGAAGLSTAISASIGVTALCVAGVQPWGAFGTLWWVWWIGDALGALVVAPLLLAWADVRRARAWRRFRPEALVLLGSVVLVAWVAFGRRLGSAAGPSPVHYAVFPFVLWAAMRFGQAGTATVTAVVAGIAIWGTVTGAGVFATGTVHERLVLLQLFMGVVAITGMLLAAAITELRRAEHERAVEYDRERLARIEADRARREAEAARTELAVSEARLKGIIASATDAIITIDEQQRITLFNDAAEAIFGCRAADVLGHPIDRFVPARSRDVHRAHIAAFGVTRVGTRPMGGERVLTAVRATGEEFPMEACISQVSVGGEKLFTVILRDVTQRRQAESEREELLAHAQRARAEAERAQTAAEAANRAKDQFLALVSHELRTPLSPIMVWARMLRTEEMNRADSFRALETIERNAQMQARLIDDLLDVSRVVQGKLRLDLALVDPVGVVEAALETVQASVQAKALHVRREFVATGPVAGDAARLQQVLWNLLSNAVKFTPRGGRIAVRVAPVDAAVEIAVSDSGCGIPADDLPRVFERFWQGQGGTERHGGLGLGLAIVRHIVELHGGTIGVDSPGRGAGAVFRVELPVAPEARRTPQPRAHGGPGTIDGYRVQEPRLDRVRVLVVDDDPDTRSAVRDVLAARGAEVRVAASAGQALAVLDRWQPKVLVSDIAMPGEDGYELIARIRARRPERGGTVAAVALTALAGSGDRARILAAGFQVHATKPVDPAALTLAVASLAGPSSRPA